MALQVRCLPEGSSSRRLDTMLIARETNSSGQRELREDVRGRPLFSRPRCRGWDLPTIRQLDPLSLIIASDHGAILYYARQYDRAIEQFRAVLDMDPYFSRAGLVQSAYLEKGMYAESMAELNRWPHEGPWYWARVAALMDVRDNPKRRKLRSRKCGNWKDNRPSIR